jgi:hypothetical protein
MIVAPHIISPRHPKLERSDEPIIPSISRAILSPAPEDCTALPAAGVAGTAPGQKRYRTQIKHRAFGNGAGIVILSIHFSSNGINPAIK